MSTVDESKLVDDHKNRPIAHAHNKFQHKGKAISKFHLCDFL